MINIKTVFFFSFLLPGVSSATEAIQLNNPDGTGIERFRISSDSNYVVFNERSSTDNTFDRHSIKIDGQSDPIVITENVSSNFFSIHADSSRIISRGEDENGISTLYESNDIDGSSSTVNLTSSNSNFPIAERIRSASIFSRTNLFLFATENDRLLTIPFDGTQSAVDITSDLEVDLFRWSNDRQHVAFSAFDASSNSFGLYITNSDGSSSPTLLATLPENTDVDGGPRFTDDDSRIIYIAETFDSNGDIGVESLQLFTVPSDGSSDAIAVGETIVGNNIDIDFISSNDSQRVVYALEDLETDFVQLYSSPVNSNDPHLVDEGIELHQFEITNSDQFIIY